MHQAEVRALYLGACHTGKYSQVSEVMLKLLILLQNCDRNSS